MARECHPVPQPSDLFASSAELAPAVSGTLAGWDPVGRWFLNLTNVLITRDALGNVVVGRDLTASLNDTELFARGEFFEPGSDTPIVRGFRVSNLREDGTARAEQVSCRDGSCMVCTTPMVRATHNAGEAEAERLTLVGEYRDPAWQSWQYTLNVRVAGTLAFLIRDAELSIIETADPSNPVLVGRYLSSKGGGGNDVKLVESGAKRYAVIATSPVEIVDVTDPAQPTQAALIPAYAHTLFVEHRGDQIYLYLAGESSVPIYDITDPRAPMLAGSYQSASSYVHDLSVENGIAYLNAWEGGFLMVDFTMPAQPVLLGAWAPTTIGASHSSWPTTVDGHRIAVHGDEGYGAHLDVIDIDPASPSFMQPIGEYKTRDAVSIHNVMAIGRRAFVAYYQDGVRVVDLANPEQPALLGYFNTWNPESPDHDERPYLGASGIDVDVARKLIFVADTPRGLVILQDHTE
ncbi:MAG: LVIVD repeat-containing protein [Kofleriaceae bacterium]